MQRLADARQPEVDASPTWQRDGETGQRDSAPLVSRLDFRHLSSHLSQKRPGYYLIMLRNELRHRSIREKPALNE
jgi:hypothetical protein